MRHSLISCVKKSPFDELRVWFLLVNPPNIRGRVTRVLSGTLSKKLQNSHWSSVQIPNTDVYLNFNQLLHWRSLKKGKEVARHFPLNFPLLQYLPSLPPPWIFTPLLEYLPLPLMRENYCSQESDFFLDSGINWIDIYWEKRMGKKVFVCQSTRCLSVATVYYLCRAAFVSSERRKHWN